MNSDIWPFRPNHITKDGPSAKPNDVEKLRFSFLSEEYKQTIIKRRKDLKKLTGTGIISNAYLEGLQTTICANLGNATTIIEFSPEGEPIRTDSKLLFSSMLKTCKIFRDYTNEQACLDCDNCHAKLFYNLSLANDLSYSLQERLKGCEFISTNINNGFHCKIISDPRRCYLEYDCPWLGYRELVFPIFFEDNVIAVFFAGQLQLESRRDEIVKQQNNFFEKPPDQFLKYCPDEAKRKQLIEKMKNAAEYEKRYMDQNLYNDFINLSIEEIEGLEKLLDQQIRIKRGQYISTQVDEVIMAFGDKLHERPASGEEKWKLLWQNTAIMLEKFIKDFSLRYIVVFANQGFEVEISPLLDVVSKAGNLPDELSKLIDSGEMQYDLTNIPPNVRKPWLTSIDEPLLFNGINKDKKIIDEAYNCIRIFLVPFFPDATMTVLVGYMPDCPLNTVPHRPYELLREASRTFYELILSTFSATLAGIAEEGMLKKLGRISHELRSPIIAIRGATESIIDTLGSKTIFDKDYPGDIWSWTELMTRVIDNADVYRYIHKDELEIQPERIFLLTDVIAPAIRQVKLLLKARKFPKGHITYIGFEKFPPLWLDRNRFQQIIFNLLSNSIKYAYDEPSLFEVEIEGIEEGEFFYIYIRDWGTGIETTEKEKVFEEEFRNEKAIEKDVTGQGLGLWIVKQIVAKHNGKIRVSNVYNPTELEIQLPYWLTSKAPHK